METQIATQHITAAEFMRLPETNRLHELIGGEAILSPTPATIHQRVALQLLILLNSIIPNGELFIAPLSVYLDEFNIPEPDLFWISTQNTHAQITDKWINGAPDLVVEIFSPSTARRDKKEKFQLYEKHGVREYWMVDPAGQYIEIWAREGDRFAKVGVFGSTDACVSPLLGNVDLMSIFPDA